jgi:two-component system KDP operon response regulator KdpE
MSERPPRILVVDDEESIRRFLRATLVGHGYDVTDVATGTEALHALQQNGVQLVVLDLGLPDISGREVLLQLRLRSSLPVVILSAIRREEEKVAALDAGADDYLTKPFSVQELLARLRAVLRRSSSETPAEHRVGELLIDFTARRVFVRKQEVHLTPTEFRLLALMAKHSGKVLTHRFLLNEVWGQDQLAEVNYLRVFMAGMRKKIEENSAQPRYLLTDQGVGYRLADE